MRASQKHPIVRRANGRHRIRRTCTATVEQIEGRVLLTQLDVFPDMSTAAIQQVISSAPDGAVVFFNDYPQGQPTQRQAYALTERLALKGTSSSSGIEYKGVPATYDSVTGAVTDPGTVITVPAAIQVLPHNHYAFNAQSGTLANIKIDNLTFDGCGICALNGSVDHLTVTNNLCRNGVADPNATPDIGVPYWVGAVNATTGLTNSTINYNVFQNEWQPYGIWLVDPGIYNNVDVSHNVFSNSAGGIHIVLKGGVSGDNTAVSVTYNSGVRLAETFIEIQGDTATGLLVSHNRVSDFSSHNDSTLALSVPINGPWVSGMQVTYNEVSDIPGVGTPNVNDHLAGVRLGLEVGGPTSGAINAVPTTISNNKLYGTVVPISLTGGYNGQSLRPSTVADNTVVYYTGAADGYGVDRNNADQPTESGAPATKELPTGITNTPVAFDAWVTGDGTGHTFNVHSDGTITEDSPSNTVGAVPDNSGIPGLGPGRAIIYGMGGNNSMNADTSGSPTVLSQYAFAGGVGAGSTPVAGTATLLGGAGTDTLFGGTNNDVLKLDMTQAAFFPGNTITVGQRVTTDGGAGSGGDYTFELLGTSGADTVTFNSGGATFNGESATEMNVNAVQFDGRLGGDTVAVNGGPSGVVPSVAFTATQNFASLSIADGASASLTAGINGVLVTQGLTLNGTDTLDLTDEDMILDYSGTSPDSTIRSLLTSAFLGGTGGVWTGSGITSSSAAANHLTMLGYGEASTILGSNGGTFDGVSVDNTAILVKYTWGGDANLDGQVDVTDLGILSTNWQKTGQEWDQGDFNYDGTVDVFDLGFLSTNWQKGVGNPLAPTGSGGTDSTAQFMTIAQQLGLTEQQLKALEAILGTKAAGPRL